MPSVQMSKAERIAQVSTPEARAKRAQFLEEKKAMRASEQLTAQIDLLATRLAELKENVSMMEARLAELESLSAKASALCSVQIADSRVEVTNIHDLVKLAGAVFMVIDQMPSERAELKLGEQTLVFGPAEIRTIGEQMVG